MKAFTEQKYFTGEINLNYVEGPDNGTPLILVPGQGAEWSNYEKILPLLSNHYHVFAVDVRGHGGSDFTPGDYTFISIGRDMIAFIENVVGEPAIISGNSSGGLIALWLAANRPDLVRAIILEDAPLFSADWPRIKEDSYVYTVLQVTIEMSKAYHESRSIGELAKCFMKIRRPIGDGKFRGVPKSAAYFISFLIRASQKIRPGNPSLPGRFGKITEALNDFDADFSQAWIDGRIYEGLDHAEDLQRVKCPMLLLHADWVRDPEYGLVGAMDDEDAKKARKLAPHLIYKRIEVGHVIHSEQPEFFVEEIDSFISQMELS